MRKIKSVLITLVGVFIFMAVVCLFIPQFAEPFNILTTVTVKIFKLFFFRDVLKTVIIWLVLAFIFVGGLYMSKKFENKLWAIASIVVTVMSFFAVK